MNLIATKKHTREFPSATICLTGLSDQDNKLNIHKSLYTLLMPWLLIFGVWLSMTAQASSLSEVSVLKTWKSENWASAKSTIINPDARFAITQEKESMVVREIETNKAVFKVTAPNDTLSCFPSGFSKEGEWLFALCYNRLRVWNWKTRKLVLEYNNLEQDVTFIQSSQAIYFGGNFSNYFLYYHFCLRKVCKIARFNHQQKAEVVEVDESYRLLKMIGDYAIFLTEKGNTFATFNLQLSQPAMVVFQGHGSGIRDIEIDLGRNLAVSQTQSTKIWDLDTGREIASLIDPDEPRGFSHPWATQVVISPNSKWLFTIAQSETKIWDLETRRLYKSLKNSVLPIFSRDGQVMIHAEGGDVVFTQIGSFNELFRLKSHLRRAYPQAISSDGTRLISTSMDQSMKIWNPKQKKLLKTLGIYQYSVVNDFGTVIGLARGDAIMHFYETKSGRFLSRVFIGSEYGENHLKLSPNGRYLAFGEVSYYRMIMGRTVNKTRIRVWNIRTGRHLWTNFLETPNELMFRSDGQKVVAMGENSSSTYSAVEFDTLTGKTKRLNLPTSTQYLYWYTLLHEVDKQFKILVRQEPRESQPNTAKVEGFVFNLTTQKKEKIIKKALCFLSSSTNLNRYLQCKMPKFYSREGEPESLGFDAIEQSPSKMFYGYFGLLTLVEPFKDGVKYVGNLVYGAEEPSLDSLGYWSARLDFTFPRVKNFSSNRLYFFTHAPDGIYMIGSKQGHAIF